MFKSINHIEFFKQLDRTNKINYQKDIVTFAELAEDILVVQ